ENDAKRIRCIQSDANYNYYGDKLECHETIYEEAVQEVRCAAITDITTYPTGCIAIDAYGLSWSFYATILHQTGLVQPVASSFMFGMPRQHPSPFELEADQRQLYGDQ